jgi:hypothetical protein
MTSTGSSSSAGSSDAGAAGAALVVGLLSYRDAGTIGAVATAVRDGLAGGYAGVASRIVVADAGSAAGTIERIREVLGADANLIEVKIPRAGLERLELPYHGIPAKSRALHAILTTARDLNAGTCVVVDGGLRSMSPAWIDALARPVTDHAFDLVAPFYRRHAYEGALVKGLVYPMFRALYGVRLRQPAPAEFACSARLRDRLLAEDIWEREGASAGIDLWLTAAAAAGEFRVGEAALGVRAHQARGEDALDLGATMAQVVGSLFADLESRADRWQRTRGSQAVQRFGAPPAAMAAASPGVDPERLVESFRLGYRELRDVWTYVIPTRTIVDLRRLVDGPPAQFRLDDEVWARIVYDFAVAYRVRALARDHLLRSLVPLYLGWLASFILQVRDLDFDGVEQRVDALGRTFETQKAYLISRWRWPERLRS